MYSIQVRHRWFIGSTGVVDTGKMYAVNVFEIGAICLNKENCSVCQNQLVPGVM